MQRIRLLRIVIPIALLAFLVAIVFTFRPRPPRSVVDPKASSERGSLMQGFRFSDFVGGRRRLLVQARVGRVDDQGSFEVDHVERLEVDREGQGPLLLTALRGAGSGAQGKRIVRLEGGVTLKDDDAGIAFEIPTVEIDQITGVVRSLGAVRFSSETWQGTASAIVYSLAGEPTQILSLALVGGEGGHIAAQRTSIAPGSRILTLSGNVEASQGGMSLRAESVVLVRGKDGRLEQMTATPSVTGTATALGGASGFVAREARVFWGRGGNVTGVSLSGGARIQHVRGSLGAERIEAKAIDSSGEFAIEASGQVVVNGPTPKGVGKLLCEALRATIGAHGDLRDGVATGNVQFDGEETYGEAEEASLTSLDPEGTVTLRASADRRARLAGGKIRIVADTIVSDLHGVNLSAEGRVESTMLAGPETQRVAATPMFAANEAVHFVSSSLSSTNGGAHLLYRGDVRGWQGERTLAADEVEIVEEGEVLNARGHVATRMPREEARATMEADYVQVVAERLSYRGRARTAEYDGNVRVRQAEGWLESDHLVAILAESGRGLREVQALQGVRFEYRAALGRGVPTTTTGDGDRAVYETTSRVLRVFGDKKPASVRRTGPSGGTTVGRVLRYELDTGALSVESGERDRATIRTEKN